MKPLALNLSKMKKVAGDAHSSTFQHPNGHHMVIAHSGVSALQRKQLEKMPVHKFADGGDTIPVSLNPQVDSSQINPDPGSLSRESAVTAAHIDPNDLPYGVTPDSIKSSDRSPADSDKVESSQSSPIPGDGIAQQAPVAAPAGSPIDINKAYQQGQSAITEQQKVDESKAKAQQAEIEQDLPKRELMQEDFERSHKALSDQRTAFMKDLQDEHINPNHYFESMGTGQKVATAIGLLLGGFSSPFNGGRDPAMDFINKQIDRDIDAQRASMDKRKTLLAANQAALHDDILAQNQTRANMNDIYDHKIQLAAAKLGTPQAKAAADAAHAKFAMENAALLQQSAMRMTALQGAGSGQVDPAKLVQWLVPKEHQAKAFGEIEAAENTRKMASEIMNSFDQAAKDNTVAKTGAGYLRTPPSVGALHQAMQPTFKDLEGTVRQAAMDNTFKNITPMPGDLDSTIQTKRHALEQYLQSKLSAPTARGYGIDLSRYQSTAPMQSTPSNSLEGKTASDGRGNRIIMKNGRWVPYAG